MSAEIFKNKSFTSKELGKCPFTGAGTPAKFSAGSCLLYTSDAADE